MATVNKERLVQSFLELVQIDSESGNEREIADFLKEKLASLGLEVYEDDTQETTGLGSGNVIAKLKGTASDVEPILFCCHFDTVTPGNGVKPVVNGDVIESDKTTILGADDKAGIAALLEAVQVIKESGLPHGDVEFVFTAGEEIGLVGTLALDMSRLNAKFGYTLDSGGAVGEVIVASPHMARMDVKIYGKAAHAGVAPEDGISAIEIAAEAISQMELGRLDFETTANIGAIKGGERTNIVCDYVELKAEARSICPDKLKKQVEAMQSALEEVAKARGGRVEIETVNENIGYNLTSTDPVVVAVETAIYKIGRTPTLASTGGASDANIFSMKGIPTANLGLGYQDIHSKDEKMPIPELVKAAELVVAIINVVEQGY